MRRKHVAKGQVMRGFDAVVSSTIPLGGGVSSSSALCVVAAKAFEASNNPAFGCSMDPCSRPPSCYKPAFASHCFFFDSLCALSIIYFSFLVCFLSLDGSSSFPAGLCL